MVIALHKSVKNRRRKDIRELRGKIKFSENYNYKLLRK